MRLIGAVMACAVGILWLVGPTMAGPVGLAQAGPLTEIRRTDGLHPDSHGVWRSRGYGWIVSINENGLIRYQSDGETCFETPEAAKGVTETLSLEYRYFRMGPSRDWAVLQLLPDDTPFVFDRIDAVPEDCTQSRTWTYTEIFDVYARLFAQHYAFFEEREIDWPKRVALARATLPEVTTDEAFFDLLAGMIDGFSDSHTKLIALIDGERRRQQDGQGKTLPMIRSGMGETPWLIGLINALTSDSLDKGAQHVANDRIIWGQMDDRVGYLQIFTMGGFSGVGIDDPTFREAEFAVFDSVMDEAMAAFDGMDAVIVDLSNNRGGYDAIARRLAGRFTDAPLAAYTTQARGTGQPPLLRTIPPAEGSRFTGPVYVLTSDVTVSGGELATLALTQLPHVTHVGGTTRGSFSTVLAKPLPNGWVVELSNEVFAAPDGTVYEEVGIVPERVLDVFPADEPVKGHVAAVAAILDMVHSDE